MLLRYAVLSAIICTGVNMSRADEVTPAQATVMAVRKLPDLRALAAKQVNPKRPERDVYFIQDELAKKYAVDGVPYFWSMPQRRPPSKCSAGTHSVPHVDAKIVHPRSRRFPPAKIEQLLLTEEHLHEVEHHGRAFTTEQKLFLDSLIASQR